MAGNIYFAPSSPSLGANLGNALGQGILGGIQNIIDLRAKKMQQQEAAKAFKDLGFTEAEAQGISKLDPALQQVYLRQKKTTSPAFDQSGLAALQQLGVDPALAQFGSSVLGAAIKEKLKPNTASGIKAVIPGISDEEAQVIANLPPSLQSAYFRHITQSPIMGQSAEGGLGLLQQGALGSPLEVPGMEQVIPGAEQDILQAIQGMQAPAGIQALQQLAPQVSQQEVAPEALASAIQEQPKVPERKKSLAERTQEARAQRAAQLEKERLEKESRTKEAQSKKAALEERRQSEIEQERINKSTQKTYEEITRGSRAAESGLRKIEQLESIIARGNLPGAREISIQEGVNNFGRAIGGLIPGGGKLGTPVELANSFRHPDSKEFKKIVQSFSDEVLQEFKGLGSLSDKDITFAFSKFPDLYDNDLGKRQILDRMRSVYEAKLARQKALERVIEKNGGKRPANLEIAVQIEAKPELDRIANKFKYGRQFATLPLPSDLPVGFEFTDSSTGTKYRNNGERFVPVS